MTVVMKIQELVVPLCYYSEGVLDKGHDDKEAADGREEPVCFLFHVSIVRARGQLSFN